MKLKKIITATHLGNKILKIKVEDALVNAVNTWTKETIEIIILLDFIMFNFL